MESTVQETSSLSLSELHDNHFDGNKLWETYSGKGSGFSEDSIDQIMPCLIKIFSSGVMRGKTLCQLTLPFHIHYTFPASEYFKEIILGTTNESSLQDIEKWLKNEPDTFDMSHIAPYLCDGETDRERWIKKQNMLRSKMKQVYQYNISKSNVFDPNVVPPVDCLLLTYCLELLTLDKETYCKALKNVSLSVKPGGYVIMVIAYQATFYMVGNVKFPHLCFDEGFLRKALTDTGYCIEKLLVLPRKCQGLFDICDYTHKIVLYARKEAGG
ncbi:nicotinamide N-methyltransferase-like [Ambystoma mexicanum]|uniref:nicotinamide N-methyltransferase-like n=1 Tax=Ambystoma mexicanum TaxID=8296 RepID=UPI0037E8581C